MPPPFILTNLRLFTGTETLPNAYIHISPTGKIASLGPVSSLPNPLPPNTPLYSKPNHTLLPGLIDSHMHADNANPLALPQSLHFGITTVCEMHNETANVAKLLAQSNQQNGEVVASYKTASQAATLPNGWPTPVILAHSSSAATKAQLATWPKLQDGDIDTVKNFLDNTGPRDYVKLMHESGTPMNLTLPKPSLPLQKLIVAEARLRGLKTVAHALSLRDTLEVLDAGVHGLTHAVCDEMPTKELVEEFRRRGVWVCPTLAAVGSLTGEGRGVQEGFAKDERVERLLGEGGCKDLGRCMGMVTGGRGRVECAYEWVRGLRGVGVDIVCGSDAAGPALGTAFGLTVHHELHLFVNEIGMAPEEALRSATSVPARCFGFADRGRLAEGLNADLLLVEGDPLREIGDLLNIRGVWREGRGCELYGGYLDLEG